MGKQYTSYVRQEREMGGGTKSYLYGVSKNQRMFSYILRTKRTNGKVDIIAPKHIEVIHVIIRNL